MAKSSTVTKKKSSRKSRKAAAQKQSAVTNQAVALAPKGLSNGWQLTRASYRFLTNRWRYWLGFVAILALLNLLLVHNFSTDVVSLKEELASFLGANSALTGLGTYALVLASNSSAASGDAAVYQYVLLVIGSLAVIWALRQFMSDNPAKSLRIRDSFYKGMHPLIPFLLVLVVLSIELVPMLVTGALYSTAIGGGVARSMLEQLIFVTIFGMGVLLSVWLVTRTLFAMYIVTLLDMTPVKALRDSVRIVKGRQLNVIRKLAFLLLVLLLASLVVLLPIIFVLPVLTQFAFFILSMIAVPFVHTYLYTLYRELLDEPR